MASLNAVAVNGNPTLRSASVNSVGQTATGSDPRSTCGEHVRPEARHECFGPGKECPERDTLDFDESYLKCQGAIDFGSMRSFGVNNNL
jgi:hypothetical protein